MHRTNRLRNIQTEILELVEEARSIISSIDQTTTTNEDWVTCIYKSIIHDSDSACDMIALCDIISKLENVLYSKKPDDDNVCHESQENFQLINVTDGKIFNTYANVYDAAKQALRFYCSKCINLDINEMMTFEEFIGNRSNNDLIVSLNAYFEYTEKHLYTLERNGDLTFFEEDPHIKLFAFNSAIGVDAIDTNPIERITKTWNV